MSWILRVIFMLPMVSGIVVAQEADTSNTLENVVIEESFEGEFGEEKPPIKLDLDFSDIVAFSDNLSWRSIDHILGSADNRKEIGMRLRLSSPYLANIRPAPVKDFHVRFKNILRWQLDITASDGSLFRTISGNGTPPGTIAWDGRSNSGGVLAAGENYAYSFTAVDKAGNKRTFPGETFSVPAFYLQEEEHLLIGVAYSLLFSE